MAITGARCNSKHSLGRGIAASPAKNTSYIFGKRQRRGSIKNKRQARRVLPAAVPTVRSEYDHAEAWRNGALLYLYQTACPIHHLCLSSGLANGAAGACLYPPASSC
jgi:hypothetical protein